MKLTANSLGMSGLTIERPTARQKAVVQNILANINFDLVVSVSEEAAKAGVSTTIPVRGCKVITNGQGEAIVVTPSFLAGNSRAPFYPLGRLGEIREKYILSLYEMKKAEWAATPELPEEDKELDIELAGTEAAVSTTA